MILPHGSKIIYRLLQRAEKENTLENYGWLSDKKYISFRLRIYPEGGPDLYRWNFHQSCNQKQEKGRFQG